MYYNKFDYTSIICLIFGIFTMIISFYYSLRVFLTYNFGADYIYTQWQYRGRFILVKYKDIVDVYKSDIRKLFHDIIYNSEFRFHTKLLLNKYDKSVVVIRYNRAGHHRYIVVTPDRPDSFIATVNKYRIT